MTFTETIRKALEAHGKTQKDLAEYLGLTDSAMSLKIRMKRDWWATEFFKTCNYLHLDQDELFRIYCDDLTK